MSQICQSFKYFYRPWESYNYRQIKNGVLYKLLNDQLCFFLNAIR